jgi:tRNA pseudouridine55 synthase
MARRRKGRPINGWIVLDKAQGMTSNDAVIQVRRLFDAAKAGHAGTLDPLATGILPIALGEATKCVAMMMETIKGYRFTIRWGEERDTDDSEGAIVAVSGERPDAGSINTLLPSFTGIIQQVPPTYSAIKVAGERAYDLAREGRPAVLSAREVHIDGLRLLDIPDRDHAVLEMTCGKGAYVRSVARDLGRELGCRGHVSQLRRTVVGPFDESHAIPLDSLNELGHKGALDRALKPVETALVDIPALAGTGKEADRLKCGQAIRVPNKVEGTVYAMTDGRPVALAQVKSGEVRPVRVFNL